METKVCQNCKKEFNITSQDASLLEKLGMPAPSFCSVCSMIDRMLWRNERTLYKNTNSAPGSKNNIISIFSPESGIKIYDNKTWWGDSWDSLDYGIDYDFSKPFFLQFSELAKKVPFPALQNWNAVNSDYCNCTTDNKNCYMVFGGDFNEDSFYSMYNIFCKNVCDVYWMVSSDFCYELIVSERCHKVIHGMYIRDCTDSAFLYDCVNCTNCIGCVGLRNKSNCILNEQYSKEGFLKEKSKFRLDTYSGQEEFRKKFNNLKKKIPIRFAYLVKTQNVVGDRVVNSKDCDNCFDIVGPAENLKDCYNAGWNATDMLRTSHAGYGSELLYNSFGVFSSAQKVFCSAYIPSGTDVYYSYNCPNGSNLFGCVGVKKGNYMILNKKYSKEEYLELLPKIKKHMKEMPYIDSKGNIYSFGDFFPGELSFFAYNESVAQDLYMLNEKDIISKGYKFHSRSHSKYSITTKNIDILDGLPNSFDEITNQIFECRSMGENVYCSGAYKIASEEFAFYQRMGIPLPRYCFNCRHYLRFENIKSMVLNERVCDCRGVTSSNGEYINTINHNHENGFCGEKFQTTYAGPEKIVYCEKCYQKEIL